MKYSLYQDHFYSRYLDDELIFAIPGSSLTELTGSLIPVEPMYLILNTAISHRWGMPEPCDITHCKMCWRCYDCTNPDCQCTLPKGMQNCKNLPAEMKIDYIRLYQDPNDSKHTIGCSPPLYPTIDYITSHEQIFANWKPYEGSMPIGYGYILQRLITIGVVTLIIIGLWIFYGIIRIFYYFHFHHFFPYGYRYQPIVTADEDSSIPIVTADFDNTLIAMNSMNVY